MSTNYYIAKKKLIDLDEEVRKEINKIDYNQLEDEIRTSILDKYKGVFNKFDSKDQGPDKFIENFRMALDEQISIFVYRIRLDLNEYLQINLDTLKHIGKNSAGWLFLFKYQDEWKSYDELKTYLLEKFNKDEDVIIDEYGYKIEPEEFIKLVDSVQVDKHNVNNPDNFKYNDNVKGYRFTNGNFS